MKRTYYILMTITLGLLLSLYACEEQDAGGPKPPTIEDFVITPINGGGIISYSVPNDEDVMYIMAEYIRDGKQYSDRSSVYKNTITIEGFATTDKVNLTLYTVSRSGVKSDPVHKEFTPLKAPIHLIRETLKIVTDFAGVSVFWTNTTGKEIGVTLLSSDDQGNLTDPKYDYSWLVDAKITFRGYPVEEKTFAVFLTDEWGNASDTAYLTTTPYFETESKKPFVKYNLPGDTNVALGGWPFSRLSDGIHHTSVGGGNAWLTTTGKEGHMFTLDLQERMQLSRITMWPRVRTESEAFGSVNVEKFEIWGTDQINTDKIGDVDYWQDIPPVPEEGGTQVANFRDEWQYLGEYTITQPDAGEGSQVEANLQACFNGFSFDLPIDAKPVRYVRFIIRSTFNGVEPGIYPTRPLNDYFMISELSIFGDNTIPQN